jgi:hypothetical protein
MGLCSPSRIKRAAEKIKAKERYEAYMREMAIKAKEDAEKAAIRKEWEEKDRIRKEKALAEAKAKRVSRGLVWKIRL